MHRRLRAPKRPSPTSTPTQQGFFEPLPSPGVEHSGNPFSAPTSATSHNGSSTNLTSSGYLSSSSPVPQEPKPLYLCQPFVKAALVKGSFKTIVAPPKYVDVNEWVAVNCECYPDP